MATRSFLVVLLFSLIGTLTFAFSSTPTTATAAAASTTTTIPKQAWAPTKIQHEIDYNAAVERLYVRQIVTATYEMAQLIVTQYLKSDRPKETIATSTTNKDSKNGNDDVFAQLAKSTSVCVSTREDGGKIGWVERVGTASTTNELLVEQGILSESVIQQLYALQPKAGDIHIVASSDDDDDDNNSQQRFHVLQVLEIWTNPSYAVMEQARKKLPGLGIVPKFPTQLKSYTIQTAGCQMNVADTERIEGVLQNQVKLQKAENPASADLVIFNTCSIRDHAEQKLYDALGPYAAQKRKGTKQVALIVTGCVAQQEGEALLQRIPELDAVVGPQYVPYFQNILQHIQDNGNQVVYTAPMLLQQESTDNELYTPPVRGHDVRAWVNVIYGCNERCTYCVVPATRGVEQSRTLEAILQECKALADANYKEVTLLGQNIDAYGRDMVPKRTFADLLHYLNDNLATEGGGIERIRYVTSHPRYFSDRVIDAVANLDKVCECFHMPFQAGDDTVLKNMRRGYTYDSYLKIIHKIRAAAPDAAITTDIIVGFPGETEEQFQKTLDLMEAVKFDNVNSFAYSPRPNTEAADFETQVPENIKTERLYRVQQLANQHGQERSNRYLDRTVEVLVEDANPKNPKTQVMGRTRQGRQVYFDGDLEQLKGKLVQVHITEARTWSLMGELVEDL